MKKSGISNWFIVAVSIFMITISIGTYESVTEKYKPQDSIVNALHAYGYLKEYQVRYEPSKGIWHILGWTGSAFMVTMMLYSVRKRFSMFAHWGALRHWLSAHIFLGDNGGLACNPAYNLQVGGYSGNELLVDDNYRNFRHPWKVYLYSNTAERGWHRPSG